MAYIRPKPAFSDVGRPSITAHGGSAELIRRVRDAERSDLVGKRWPRGKTFDDATAVYCRI
ncbi:hypothetical protein ACQP25_00415 [Microtetraspora malaysiensis]|uniref:hypothetical protein n=1 Tax=Microtetraspora malaysiensis TaxID=161358 RepID=UPI003D94A0BB